MLKIYKENKNIDEIISELQQKKNISTKKNSSTTNFNF